MVYVEKLHKLSVSTSVLRSRSKGISPLIATVLLLGITVSLAAMFPSWIVDLTSGVTSETTDQNQRILDSTSIDLEIEQARYVSPSETVQLTLRLNSGTNEINSSFNVIALCGGVTGGIKSFRQINGLETFNFGSSCEPDRIEVSLENYPKYISTEKIDVSGFSTWKVSTLQDKLESFQNAVFNPLTIERNQNSVEETSFNGQKINTTVENGEIRLES